VLLVPRLAGECATVDHLCMPGDVTRLVAGQPHRSVGDVDGVTDPTEHLGSTEPGLHLVELFIGCLREAGGERCRDDARADAVTSDAVVAEFEGDGLGEVDDRGLGHAVEVWRPAGLEPGDRRGVDDRSRSLLR